MTPADFRAALRDWGIACTPDDGPAFEAICDFPEVLQALGAATTSNGSVRRHGVNLASMTALAIAADTTLAVGDYLALANLGRWRVDHRLDDQFGFSELKLSRESASDGDWR